MNDYTRSNPNIGMVVIGRKLITKEFDAIQGLGGFYELIDIPFTISSEEPLWQLWKTGNFLKNIGIGPGSAGCLLGHMKAWGLFEAGEFDALLVLESDALITKYGVKNLSRIIHEFKQQDFNILHLGNDEKAAIWNPAQLISVYGLRKTLKEFYERIVLPFLAPEYSPMTFTYSTHAYLIKSEFGKALLFNAPNFLLPADVLLNGMSQVKANKIARSRVPIFIQDYSSSASEVNSIGR